MDASSPWPGTQSADAILADLAGDTSEHDFFPPSPLPFPRPSSATGSLTFFFSESFDPTRAGSASPTHRESLLSVVPGSGGEGWGDDAAPDTPEPCLFDAEHDMDLRPDSFSDAAPELSTHNVGIAPNAATSQTPDDIPGSSQIGIFDAFHARDAANDIVFDLCVIPTQATVATSKSEAVSDAGMDVPAVSSLDRGDMINTIASRTAMTSAPILSSKQDSACARFDMAPETVEERSVSDDIASIGEMSCQLVSETRMMTSATLTNPVSTATETTSGVENLDRVTSAADDSCANAAIVRPDTFVSTVEDRSTSENIAAQTSMTLIAADGAGQSGMSASGTTDTELVAEMSGLMPDIAKATSAFDVQETAAPLVGSLAMLQIPFTTPLPPPSQAMIADGRLVNSDDGSAAQVSDAMVQQGSKADVSDLGTVLAKLLPVVDEAAGELRTEASHPELHLDDSPAAGTQADALPSNGLGHTIGPSSPTVRPADVVAAVWSSNPTLAKRSAANAGSQIFIGHESSQDNIDRARPPSGIAAPFVYEADIGDGNGFINVPMVTLAHPDPTQDDAGLSRGTTRNHTLIDENLEAMLVAGKYDVALEDLSAALGHDFMPMPPSTQQQPIATVFDAAADAEQDDADRDDEIDTSLVAFGPDGKIQPCSREKRMDNVNNTFPWRVWQFDAWKLLRDLMRNSGSVYYKYRSKRKCGVDTERESKRRRKYAPGDRQLGMEAARTGRSRDAQTGAVDSHTKSTPNHGRSLLSTSGLVADARDGKRHQQHITDANNNERHRQHIRTGSRRPGPHRDLFIKPAAPPLSSHSRDVQRNSPSGRYQGRGRDWLPGQRLTPPRLGLQVPMRTRTPELPTDHKHTAMKKQRGNGEPMRRVSDDDGAGPSFPFPAASETGTCPTCKRSSAIPDRGVRATRLEQVIDLTGDSD